MVTSSSRALILPFVIMSSDSVSELGREKERKRGELNDDIDIISIIVIIIKKIIIMMMIIIMIIIIIIIIILLLLL